MNRPLTIEEAAMLAGQLRNAGTEMLSRQQTSEKEFVHRRGAEMRSGEVGARERSQLAADQRATLQARHATELSAQDARFTARKARIGRAHRNLRKGAFDDIEKIEGRGSFAIQKGTLDAEKKRDSELLASDAEHRTFVTALKEEWDGNGRMEERAIASTRGLGAFEDLLGPEQKSATPDLSGNENQLLAQLKELNSATSRAIEGFRGRLIPKIFRIAPPWLMLVVIAGSHVAWPMLAAKMGSSLSITHARLGAAAAAGLVVIAYLLARYTGKNQARGIAEQLLKARWLHQAAAEKTKVTRQLRQEKAAEEFLHTRRQLKEDWGRVEDEVSHLKATLPQAIDERQTKALGQFEKVSSAHRSQLSERHRTESKNLEAVIAESDRKSNESLQKRLNVLQEEGKRRLDDARTNWGHVVKSAVSRIHEASGRPAAPIPSWNEAGVGNWKPTSSFSNEARLGVLEMDLPVKETTAEIAEPEVLRSGRIRFPVHLTYPRAGTLLLETGDTGAVEAVELLNQMVLETLAGSPPGKVSLTLIDPTGLGENFAALSHLSDYEDGQIVRHIWTQSAQIEEQLAALNVHVEKVIQMYLRNEYPTLVEYNQQAGVTGEKYHLVVVAGFPAGFGETAIRHLLNLVASGPRCGVFPMIHWDRRITSPHSSVRSEFSSFANHFVFESGGFMLAGRPELRISTGTPASRDVVTRFLQRLGEASRNVNRLELPFSLVAPANATEWSEGTGDELRVPIGRTGAAKLQYLTIGKGTRQHVLVAGKTGSGKSTLFHILITNLALRCSPDEVEFHLVDFKKGVEFRAYAHRRLPHARVVAIESDRDFGLSVLERLDEELKDRGERFRKAGVQDLPGFRRARPAESMPRALLIVDEFQEFFVQEDRISQNAAVLLDRLVRQGRAFGIHVILGSQTLGGAYTLARATMGQMVVRIALQCNEADAYLIMDENNPAPRMLSRPGEGIYNDSAGAVEANSPFQAVWLSDEERDEHLLRIRRLADKSARSYPAPIVFEGNSPADARDNPLLQKLRPALLQDPPLVPRIWIGAPNSIKGPTEVRFDSRAGSHLLVVGQHDEAIFGMTSLAVATLAAQHARGSLECVLLSAAPPGSSARNRLEHLVALMPHPVSQPTQQELTEALESLLKTPEPGADNGKVTSVRKFVIIHGLQNFRALRQEESFGFGGDDSAARRPDALFQSLLADGPARGIHVLCTCDTYNTANRFLGRKGLTEFSMRVLFQMSATDSAALMDSPAASNLGLHRAVLFDEREGWTETFRPYSPADPEFFEALLANTLPNPDSRIQTP